MRRLRRHPEKRQRHARRDYALYDGADLRPYTGRPGAMDAYALPSRIGSRLIFPAHTGRKPEPAR